MSKAKRCQMIYFIVSDISLHESGRPRVHTKKLFLSLLLLLFVVVEALMIILYRFIFITINHHHVDSVIEWFSHRFLLFHSCCRTFFPVHIDYLPSMFKKDSSKCVAKCVTMKCCDSHQMSFDINMHQLHEKPHANLYSNSAYGISK